ncbi:MAG: hypothetical protein HY757_10290 [Nitrospirae bacterium]|nr:hypothetical protein [Nitrospirota bacterium]
MKRFFAIACIIVLTLGLLLVSCQKKEEPAAPEVKSEEPAAQGEQKPAAGYGEEKPAAGGYGEEKKAEEEKH